MSAAEAPELVSRPPSSGLRWVFLAVCGALLAILSVSGFLAARYLSKMYARELAITQALEERAQMLSGLWLSIQRYNQAVEQYVAETQRGSGGAIAKAARSAHARDRLGFEKLPRRARFLRGRFI